MRWLASNWIWIVVVAAMLWMHLGHGGMHGGGHGAGRHGDDEQAHGGHDGGSGTRSGDQVPSRRHGF